MDKLRKIKFHQALDKLLDNEKMDVYIFDIITYDSNQIIREKFRLEKGLVEKEFEDLED